MSLAFILANKNHPDEDPTKMYPSAYVISVTVTTRSSLHRETPLHGRCSQRSAFQTPSTATDCIIFLVVIRCLVHRNPSPDASRIYVGGLQSLHRSRRSVPNNTLSVLRRQKSKGAEGNELKDLHILFIALYVAFSSSDTYFSPAPGCKVIMGCSGI